MLKSEAKEVELYSLINLIAAEEADMKIVMCNVDTEIEPGKVSEEMLYEGKFNSFDEKKVKNYAVDSFSFGEDLIVIYVHNPHGI